MNKQRCNHNYIDDSNTLFGIPTFKMVTPMKYNLQCKCCGEVFTVSRAEIKDINYFLYKFFK